MSVFLCRRSIYCKEGKRAIPPIYKIFRERSFIAPFSSLEVLWFAWALRYIDNAVAAAIYGSWPLLLVLILKRSSLEDYSLNRRDVILNIIAIAAAIPIFFSDISPTRALQPFGIEYLLGLALLAFAITSTIQHTSRLEQAKRFVDDVLVESERSEFGWNKTRARYANIYLALFSRLVAVVVGIVLFTTARAFDIFPSFTGTLSTISLVFLFVSGSTISAVGFLLTTTGYHRVKDLKIIAVEYLGPILSVVYILMIDPITRVLGLNTQASYALTVDWSLFIMGSMGIIFANLVIYFESEQGVFGLTSLIISLWFFGLLIFLRDRWDWWHQDIESLNASALEYYSLLGLSATVFALLVGFEIARIEQRTAREEDLVFPLMSRFKEYATSKSEALEHLEHIDANKEPSTLHGRYHKLHDIVVKNDFSDRLDSLAKLNTLVHSKQQGAHIASSVTITMLAGFIVLLSLSSRPSNVTSLAALLVDLFSLLLAAVVIYLTFHLFDLRNGRKNSSIERTDEEYYVEFSGTSPRWETITAAFLMTVIVLVYFALFGSKWVF